MFRTLLGHRLKTQQCMLTCRLQCHPKSNFSGHTHLCSPITIIQDSGSQHSYYMVQKDFAGISGNNRGENIWLPIEKVVCVCVYKEMVGSVVGREH